MTAALTRATPVSIVRDAEVSPCGRYRYTLTRRWSDLDKPDARSVAWCCLNPSMANATKDDPTVRKIIGFTQRLGYQSATVVNLFALRATHPDALTHTTPAERIGPDNDRAVLAACRTADLVIAAWGGHPLVVERAPQLLTLLLRATGEAPITLHCYGRTAAGQPRHPSRLPYAAALEVFQ